MTTTRVPAAEGLFTETAEGPRLLGSRCASCGTPYFPRSSLCHNPDCSDPRVEEAHFGPRGTLWSCAIQNYPPPPPARYREPYAPYAVGLVDLPEGLRVLGRISTDDPESLRVGADVELILEALYTDESGSEVMTWTFRPIRDLGRGH
jgi:uncharacterized OB-fold protein